MTPWVQSTADREIDLMLWLLPEPTSKLLAAGLTLAWLPVHTLWSLMDGWARLAHEVDRVTSYAAISARCARRHQER
jgi:hypothetical protein